MTIDPITLGVIQAGLSQVCDEMDLAFSRAAFSPVIAEADDRSDGIYAAEDGALIAQGSRGLPVFVGTMQYSTAELARLIAEGVTAPPEPGDIYVVNDPYLGGTHLMDVRFALPFYHRGELFCWLQNTGHWPDIGGAVPGGFSAHATEVEQEGLRLRLQLADLVEEQGAAVGLFERPLAGLLGAGEGASHVAEELALHEPARDRAEVADDERPVAPRRGGMDGLGDQLLPRARLPLEQDAHVGGGHALEDLEQPAHGFAGGDDAAEVGRARRQADHGRGGPHDQLRLPQGDDRARAHADALESGPLVIAAVRRAEVLDLHGVGEQHDLQVTARDRGVGERQLAGGRLADEVRPRGEG